MSVGIWIAISVVKIGSAVTPDFGVFYDSAQNLRAGISLYSDPTLYTSFNYPPQTLLAIMPIAWIDRQSAQIIWLIMSLAALVGSIMFARRLTTRSPDQPLQALFIASLAFFLFPVRFTLGMGQINLLALFFLVLSLWFVHIKSKLPAGIGLFIAWTLKPQLLILVPVFLWQGHFLVILVSFGLLVSATLFTGFWFGWENYLHYFGRVIPAISVFAGRDIYYNQGLSAVLSRLMPLSAARTFDAIGSLMVVCLTLIWQKRNRVGWIRSVSVWLAVMLLIEPLSWQHHYVFLLPLFLETWEEMHHQPWLAGCWLLSVFLVGSNMKQPQAWAGSPGGQIWLSHVFWGNLILLWLGTRKTKII